MSSKIKQYFANKENRIKCGITGGTIALAVVIFTVMVFMEKNETPNVLHSDCHFFLYYTKPLHGAAVRHQK